MSHLYPLPTDSHSSHAYPTRGVYTFTVTKTILRLLTSLSLGFNNRPDRKSQSFVEATGPFRGVLTSSTQSLTWRELLISLATCSCDQFHHIEDTIATHRQWQQPHTVRTTLLQHPTGIAQHDPDKFRFLNHATRNGLTVMVSMLRKGAQRSHA